MLTESFDDDVGELRLRLRLVVLVAVDHHRGDLLVTAKVPDLIEADPGFLALLKNVAAVLSVSRYWPGSH